VASLSVSRILYLPFPAGDGHPSGHTVTGVLERPTRDRSAGNRGPCLALHRVGFASRRRHRRRWWSLTPPFHPCLCDPIVRSGVIGGLLSAALSVGSPRLEVVQHPALWCPDFPPRVSVGDAQRPSDGLAIGILRCRGSHGLPALTRRRPASHPATPEMAMARIASQTTEDVEAALPPRRATITMRKARRSPEIMPWKR